MRRATHLGQDHHARLVRPSDRQRLASGRLGRARLHPQQAHMGIQLCKVGQLRGLVVARRGPGLRMEPVLLSLSSLGSFCFI